MAGTFLNYPDWQRTADTLHMYLQTIGKIKLARCDKRPERAHVRMYLTADGLTTGIVLGDASPFEISLNMRAHYVEAHNSKGKRICFPLEDGFSVAAFYKQMMHALEYIGSPTQINVRSQEFYDPVDLDDDEKHHSYDKNAVSLFLDNLHFAYGALMKFISPFRGKINIPAYYFGTMDLSCIVYSGEPAPYGLDTVISSRAFDERNCEFGFWPGDSHAAEPSFYALPYPFVNNIEGNEAMLHPDKAVFTPEKSEFFLTLKDAFSYKDPTDAVVSFLRSSFDITQKLKKWDNLDWITHPLDYSR